MWWWGGGGRRKNLPNRRIQNNICRYSFQEVEYGFPPTWVWAPLASNNRLWKGENSNFTVEKAGRLQLNHVIKVNTTSNKSRGHHVPPGMMWQEGHFTSVVFFPQTHNSCSVMSIIQTQTEGQSNKILTRTPQNCQGHEKQGKTKKPSQTRGV